MLHIWLPTQYSKLYVWIEKQKLWQVFDNWQAVAEKFSDKKACLYFPSQNVLQLESPLSASHLKQLGETGKQYLFEEISLTPVEQLLIREYQMQEHYYLYACAKSELAQWVNSASLVNIDIQLIFPDFLLLPFDETSDKKVYLYTDNETTLLRHSQTYGLSVNFFPSVIHLLQRADEIAILPVVADREINNNRLNDIIEHKLPYSQTKKTLQPIEKPVKHPLNFLQQERKQVLSPYIRITLIVAVLALICQITADAISAQQHKKATKQVSGALNAQYKTWFPENRLNQRIKIQSQIQPLLKTNKSLDDSAIHLLSRVTPLLKQANISVINLAVTENTLTLQVSTENKTLLDQFIAELQNQKIPAQLGNVTNQQTHVIGEITINQNPVPKN